MPGISKLYRLIVDAIGTIIDFRVRVRAVSFQGEVFYSPLVTLVDAATIAPDGNSGMNFVFDATTNGVRDFIDPVNMSDGQFFSITLKNTSGGALTTTTFNAASYHGTMTLPATAKQRTYEFYWDATAGLAYQTVQSAADVTI